MITVEFYQTIICDPNNLIQTAIASAAYQAQIVTDIKDAKLSPVLVLFKPETNEKYNEYLQKGYQEIRVFADVSTGVSDVDNTTTDTTDTTAGENQLTPRQVVYFGKTELYDNIKLLPGLSAYYLMETILCSLGEYQPSADITIDYSKNFLYYVEKVVKDPKLFFLQLCTAYNGYDLITKYSHIGEGIKIGIDMIV